MLRLRMFAIVLSLGLVTSVQAFGYLQCNNAPYCFFNMPVYYQADPSLGSYWFPNGPNGGTALCVPTSSAMGLMGVENEMDSLDFTSGDVTRMDVETWQQKVLTFAQMEGTDRVNGTYWGNLQNVYVGLQNDFFYWDGSPTGSGLTQGPNPTFYQAYMSQLVNVGYAPIIGNGWYYGNSETIGSDIYMWFTRNGGHARTISGYDNYPYGNGTYDYFVYVNNPASGAHEWDSVEELTQSWVANGQQYSASIPNGFTSQPFILTNSGDGFCYPGQTCQLIEVWAALWAY